MFQLYEIYKSAEHNTEHWLELRNKINTSFIECKKNYKQKTNIKDLENTYDNNIVDKILYLETNNDNKKIIYNKYKEFEKMLTTDDEKSKLFVWLNWAISLPYDKIKIFPFSSSDISTFLKKISNELDKELYGMKNVKEQIILFVSTKIQNPHMKNCSLALIGPPGVGKTNISRLLAKVLDFPFEQISFGGVTTSDYVKGHQYTYVGAEPGEIIKCLKRMKYKNGILYLDEFDQITNKDVSSALRHIIDPSQNSEYKDNYLGELNIDLSYLWIIYSMNNFPVDSALKDRIFPIEVLGYSIDDKIQIVKTLLYQNLLKMLI